MLSKAHTTYKQILESNPNAGYGKGSCGVCQAFVEESMVPRINWLTILRNKFTSMRMDEKSLATPDRRFVHRRMYIEGDRFDEEKLENVKVCVDTSGSMSDEDIAIAIVHIKRLCKQYKMSADLVYWDDGIQDIIPFDSLRTLELAKYRAMGRGGTNPNCIFEEFTNREYKFNLHGKSMPSVIIIFTDGYFSDVEAKYKRYFGRDTIWVLCSNNSNHNFKPTFGVVAYNESN